MKDISSILRFISLSIIACISFWCQSIVTEERLVPALNVIADHFNIPDDVAGATLMAAGASSPELLCTLVSLFVTHSSLGLGTIVGSEIFNQLIICAGSVYSTRHLMLILDKRMVVREVGFYAISIGLLYVALSESRDDDGDDGVDHVYVSFWKACLLFGGYILYVVVCANTKFVERCIQRLCCRGVVENQNDSHKVDEQQGHDDNNPSSDYQLQIDDQDIGSAAQEKSGRAHYKMRSFNDHDDLHQLPFTYNITSEPAENWETVDTTNPSDDDVVITNDSLIVDDSINAAKKKRRNILSAAINKSFKFIKANHLLSRDEYPAEINEFYELTTNDGMHKELRCFMWQRSIFYTKAYFGSHAFHLRWFTITPNRIVSVPNRQEPEKHIIVYPLFDEIQIDADRLIINLVHPVEGRRDFTLMAPSKAIFDAVIIGLEEYMKATRPLRLQGMKELDEGEEDDPDNLMTSAVFDADEHVELIDLPPNASKFELALWYSVIPLRYIMHYTLPDVRHLDHHGQIQKSVSYAYLSSICSLTWLIIGSFAMVTSLEALAALLGISDAIMGVTLSAAGTSLPAYIASRVAAEKGWGNQAVANVFGSNTFNICVGLGLPWVIYIAVNGFEPYHDLENEGILESILVMAGVLLIFVVLMIARNFVLVRWHANLFIGLYVVYIAYSIGQVYWSK